MTKDEALRLALEALEDTVNGCICRNCINQVETITAIKAALEAKDEPVAWMRTSGTGSPVVTEALLVEMPEMRWNFQQPLYTTPPQRKPLTDEEIGDEFVRFQVGGMFTPFLYAVRAIEAALLEKQK